MDSAAIGKILSKALEDAKKDIQDNLASSGRNASGTTSKSLRVKMSIKPDIVEGQLLGSKVLGALEFGRDKTEKRSPKGSSVWFKELQAWVRLRGLPEGAVYGIFKKINKEGYKGTKGLVTDPITEFKKTIARELKAVIIKEIRKNGVNSNQ